MTVEAPPQVADAGSRHGSLFAEPGARVESDAAGSDESLRGADVMGSGGGGGGVANFLANVAGRDGSVASVVYRRLSVLVSLLLLQSMSQFVLEAFEDVVRANLVIPLFLTMLVGAGGNAGNQSAVRAIAMLARGEVNGAKLTHVLPVVRRECVIGLVCAVALSAIGALRVFAHQMMRHDAGSSSDAAAGGGGAASPGAAPAASVAATVLAISVSLFLIVMLSAAIGAALPFVLIRFGANAEHAAPAIQVIMDVLGVFLTCAVCSLLLPSAASSPSLAETIRRQEAAANLPP